MPDESALGSVPEHYRVLLDGITDHALFLLDPHGLVVTWNTGAERLFGYVRDEVVGQPDDRFFTPEDRQQGVPGKELQEAVARGPASADRWHLRKDGVRLWGRSTTTALRDQHGWLRGFARVVRDLTERQRAGDAVEAAERRLRALVENAWDGITLVAADGTMLETTPTTFRGLGYTPEEYVGRNAFELLHPDDASTVHALLSELLRQAGGKATAQYRLRHKDGSWRWVEAVGCNLLSEPAVRAVVVNHRDVTHQKEAEEALRQADRRKDEFLAMLAHELRGPLAPLRHAVQVLRRTAPLDPNLVRTHDLIDRQVGHLSRLVDDLLDVSRIAQGKLLLRTERVEVAGVVSQAVERCRPLLDERGQCLEVLLQPALLVQADPTRLAQVVGNLLTNAAKYSPQGTGHIMVTTAGDGATVTVTVRDNGLGMAPELLASVFDLFVQADSTLRHAQGGLGIGLTLVKRLVEMHDGTVEAHSEGPGRGSTFVVRLPAAVGEDKSTQEGPIVLPSRGRRVLVVDDSVDAADTLATLLRLEGHEVRTIHEGAAVLAAARLFRPEVILLDLGLPGGLSGFDLAPRLRAEPDLENVLLVALTGYGHAEDRRLSRAAGFDAHLVKPADLDALLNLLAAGPAAVAGI